MDEKLFYPLYKDFDKKFFRRLKFAVKNKYEFLGNDDEKSQFFTDLVVLQLIKDYRKHLEIVDKNLSINTSIERINEETKHINFDFDTSWVSFKHEQEIINLAKKMPVKKFVLDGTVQGFNEFVLRYLFSIWLVDWQGPLYAILKYIENKKTIELKELNKILKLWDFTKIFKEY